MPSKSSKRIVFVSPFFYPEPISTGKYNTFLVRKLVENGNRVRVICSYPFYPGWKPVFTDKTIQGVEIIRGGLNITYPKKTILRRLILEFWFCWYFIKNIKNLKNTDLFVAILPPVFFCFFVNFGIKKAKKIAIVHDLQGVMAKTAKNPIRRIIAKVMRKIESILLCRFDKVICLSESMREMIVKNYGIKKEKCETHYPFATLEKGPENCEWEELFSINYQHLVYSGALGEKQKPHELIQFFNEVCKLKKNIQCHIFSQGPIFEEFKCLNTNSRILFNELVAEDMLSQLYACSDIQIVPQAEGTGAGAFPSKIPNLIAAGVPIMAICDRGSELDRIVRETHMGVCAYEWNIQDMVKTLDHFLKGMKREKLIRSKECIDKKFNINNIVNAVVRD